MSHKIAGWTGWGYGFGTALALGPAEVAVTCWSTLSHHRLPAGRGTVWRTWNPHVQARHSSRTRMRADSSFGCCFFRQLTPRDTAGALRRWRIAPLDRWAEPSGSGFRPCSARARHSFPCSGFRGHSREAEAPRAPIGGTPRAPPRWIASNSLGLATDVGDRLLTQSTATLRALPSRYASTVPRSSGGRRCLCDPPSPAPIPHDGHDGVVRPPAERHRRPPTPGRTDQRRFGMP